MSDDRPLDMQGRPYPHPTDAPEDEFVEWITTAYLGDAMGMHNLLVQMYEQLKEIKNELVDRCTGMPKEDPQREQIQRKLIDEVYPMLQRIETRVFKCRDRISELQEYGT